MANPSLRGHQGTFKVYQDGAEKVFEGITNVQVNMDSSMTRSFYVGSPIGEGDQSIEGWSGSFDKEVKDDEDEKFIDALITNNLNGIGVSDYTFITTENYANGTSASYVYFDCQFSISKTQAGLNEKIKKTINFQASGRQRI
jgi:hypothetical protein